MNKTLKGQVLEGVVVSAKTPMTVIVGVTTSHRHPLYKKAIKRTKRFAAHYEGMTLEVGKKVMIRETKPISKTKHFIVVEKLN
jgi:small subunit ribosomal protein S17